MQAKVTEKHENTVIAASDVATLYTSTSKNSS